MRIATTTPYQSDAAGNPITYTYSVIQPAEQLVSFSKGLLYGDTFTWPAGESQMVFGAAVTNGQNNAQGVKEVVNESATVGPDPPSASVSVTTPPPAVPGSTVTLTAKAALSNGATGTFTYAWSQLSGPKVTTTPSGGGVSFTAPPAVTGNPLTFAVTARDGSGTQAPTASTTVTVPLGNDTAPNVSIANAAALSVSAPSTLALTASGSGDGTLSYSWAVVSGGGSVAPSSGPTTTYTPGPAGVAVVRVTATDPSGASTRHRQCCRGSDRGHPDGVVDRHGQFGLRRRWGAGQHLQRRGWIRAQERVDQDRQL